MAYLVLKAYQGVNLDEEEIVIQAVLREEMEEDCCVSVQIVDAGVCNIA